ncbi:keratin, type I cytoskeletal 10-like [Ornithodoros turicata]|uniref:keratin, type I cytoskeletal 10-like n=1 Tax=Ornithodoros turicata TaxID=34597 RepID=UPI0031390FA7
MAFFYKTALLFGLTVAIVSAQDGDFGGGDFGGGGGGGDFGGGGFGGGDFGGGGGGDFGGGFGGGDFGGGGGGGDFGGSFDGSAPEPVTVQAPRSKRSVPVDTASAETTAHHRVRRGGHGYVGPVYTFVKTDHDGNFKWGARHLVGKAYGGGHHGGGHEGGYF